jgi:hypothetical protein
MSRPLPPDDRSRRESDPVEVYSPAPPSVELPPGERPGQYAQHKKVSTRIPIDGLKHERPRVMDPSGPGHGAERPRVMDPSGPGHGAERPRVMDPSGPGYGAERSGGVPVPAGLGPPRRAGTAPSATRPGTAVPVPGPPRDSSPRTEPLRGRVPTPARLPVTSRSGASAGSGVVMTRPAVIVGAPAKTTGTVPRIRKAREDEGRGFGQGLISEKSLDEVILAYLSEDADEK